MQNGTDDGANLGESSVPFKSGGLAGAPKAAPDRFGAKSYRDYFPWNAFTALIAAASISLPALKLKRGPHVAS